MQLETAHAIIKDSLTIDSGRFYYSGKNLGLGVGQIYSGIRYPFYNLEECVFDTLEGAGLVLTHECDVDQGNDRPYTEHLLFCPIIRFEDFIEEFSATRNDQQLRSFLTNLGSQSISRVMFIPWGLNDLPYGGLLYLNQIASTHISSFSPGKATLIGATTAYGLTRIDMTLTNHLLRPKEDQLALAQ
jgi:hypothetical protein